MSGTDWVHFRYGGVTPVYPYEEYENRLAAASPDIAQALSPSRIYTNPSDDAAVASYVGLENDRGQ